MPQKKKYKKSLFLISETRSAFDEMRLNIWIIEEIKKRHQMQLESYYIKKHKFLNWFLLKIYVDLTGRQVLKG